MNSKEIRARNPFVDSYLREEVEWYGRPEGVKYVRPQMRCDDYLNVNFRLDPGFDVPMLIRDNTLWMSLTWMEVQSAWPALLRARGHAATIGLGLGYFALRAAEKPEVERLTVFEQDQGNVDWFRSQFRDRPGFKKIDFVVGDARETCEGHEFDTMFADPYPELGDEDILEDIRNFTQHNDIGDYRFWGYERFLADAFQVYEMLDVRSIPRDDRLYFKYWLDTEASNMRRNHFDEQYVDDVLTEMGVL